MPKNGPSFIVALLVGGVACALLFPAASDARVLRCPAGKVIQTKPNSERTCVPAPPKGIPRPGYWRLVGARSVVLMAIEVAYTGRAYRVKRTKLKFPGPSFTCTNGQNIGATIPRTYKTALKFTNRAWAANSQDSQSTWGFSGKFSTAGVLTFDAHLEYKPDFVFAGCSATQHLTGKVQRGRGDDF
jgi:hypothetical protein